MKSLRLLALPLIASLTLSGCVIAIHDGEVESDSVFSNKDSWEKRQEKNRRAIAELKMGSSLDQVKDKLGAPDFSEAFVHEGKQYLVYFYRTQHRHSDGDTTQDETTPLVFQNGELMGWGQSLFDKISRS